MGVCCPVLQILTLFQTKKCHFPHLFSDQTSKIHTRFQTWPLGRNYVCILSADKNNSPNSFRIRIFLFLSYSFGIKTINTFIHSRSSLETIPDSRPEWAKCIPVFRPKQRKNPTRWGDTYLRSLYKGVPARNPPPPRPHRSGAQNEKTSNI